MLESIDLTVKDMDKAQYKARHEELIAKLIVLQQQARSYGIGLVADFEGLPFAGKSKLMSELLCNLDARAASVETIHLQAPKPFAKWMKLVDGVTSPEHPMKQFWTNLGERGKWTFYNDGWYYRAAYQAIIRNKAGKKAAKKMRNSNIISWIEEVNSFEAQLAADGYVVAKFFFDIDEKEMNQRAKAMFSMDIRDIRQKVGVKYVAKKSKAFRIALDAILEESNTPNASWVLINAKNERAALITIEETLVALLEPAIARAQAARAAKADQATQAAKEAAENCDGGSVAETSVAETSVAEASVAKGIELTESGAPVASRFEIEENYPKFENFRYDLVLSREDYKVQKKALQKRLYELQIECTRKQIPVIVMYEGWDAAGKGGNIKRVAQALDARGYRVITSPAPTRTELLHPFLWRYWIRLPRAGNFGLFDRSWYGRVLVERVEGFAKPAEWARAYDEINEFEHSLVNWGAVVVKFWVEINQDEQLNRFKARQENPDKQWKITDEDWRNREKYPAYYSAVEDMFRLTSTVEAPWTVLESNDKCYARIAALQTIVNAIEKKLAEIDG